MEEILIIVLCDGPVHEPGRGRDSVFGLHWQRLAAMVTWQHSQKMLSNRWSSQTRES